MEYRALVGIGNLHIYSLYKYFHIFFEDFYSFEFFYKSQEKYQNNGEISQVISVKKSVMLKLCLQKQRVKQGTT